MRAIVEFNLPKDDWEFVLFNSCYDMYQALSDLDDMLRSINKGWVDPSKEELIDKIEDVLADSKIYDLL